VRCGKNHRCAVRDANEVAEYHAEAMIERHGNAKPIAICEAHPLADEVAKHHSSHVKVDNDANAGGLAEFLWGAGRGFRNVFFATIGTGIGTGIVLDGKIFHGRTGSAAEGGHVSIDLNGPLCNCGKKGCIEVLASGTAIARRAQEKLAESPQRGVRLLELAGGDVTSVRSEMVAKAAEAGDPFSLEVLDQTLEYLAVWLGNAGLHLLRRARR